MPRNPQMQDDLRFAAETIQAIAMRAMASIERLYGGSSEYPGNPRSPDRPYRDNPDPGDYGSPRFPRSPEYPGGPRYPDRPHRDFLGPGDYGSPSSEVPKAVRSSDYPGNQESLPNFNEAQFLTPIDRGSPITQSSQFVDDSQLTSHTVKPPRPPKIDEGLENLLL